MSKQVMVLDCPHECGEQHLLRPEQFRVVRGETGGGAKQLGAIKRTAEDRRWAQEIKERDGGICRRCGDRGSDAAHIFSRRYKAIRTNLTNGLVLCRRDHRWAHEHPEDFSEWARREIGAEVYDVLLLASRGTQKRVQRKAS